MELNTSLDLFATPWMPEDSWQSVYSWINSQSNESDGGASSSVRSSTSSSHPQVSPTGPIDDQLDHPLLSDTQPKQFAPRSIGQNPATQLLQNSEYNLIHELLKLNLATNLPPTPSSSSTTSPSNLTTSIASTSNPWMCQQEEYPRECRKPLQQIPQSTPLWRNPTTEFTKMDVFAQFQPQFQQNYQAATTQQFAPIRRTNEIHSQVQAKFEETSEEYRQLEKERKQTEAELARHNLGKKISSSNGLPIPRLPNAPSRTDRIIVDFFREHARISTLLAKMEQLRGNILPPEIHRVMSEFYEAVTLLQQTRNNERNVILQQLRGENCYNEEQADLKMLHALQIVHKCATRARAANWCSLMWTLGIMDETQKIQVERIVVANYTISPPPIRPRPVKNC